MKKVYTNENRMLVWDIKNALEDEGYECIIKNEFASGGMGELSPLDTWPEVWIVDDGQYDEAVAFLEKQYRSPAPQDDWICAECKEVNAGSFAFCWHCGNAR